MSQQPFYLIVTDKDKGTFSVEGPMVDDRPWNHVVVTAQKSGRRVRCSTARGRLQEMPLETGCNDILGPKCRPVRSSICKETAKSDPLEPK